jgi:hypothetical protein
VPIYTSCCAFLGCALLGESNGLGGIHAFLFHDLYKYIGEPRAGWNSFVSLFSGTRWQGFKVPMLEFTLDRLVWLPLEPGWHWDLLGNLYRVQEHNRPQAFHHLWLLFFKIQLLYVLICGLLSLPTPLAGHPTTSIKGQASSPTSMCLAQIQLHVFNTLASVLCLQGHKDHRVDTGPGSVAILHESLGRGNGMTTSQTSKLKMATIQHHNVGKHGALPKSWHCSTQIISGQAAFLLAPAQCQFCTCVSLFLLLFSPPSVVPLPLWAQCTCAVSWHLF